MNEELKKRISDLRVALQALIADAAVEYDGDEVMSMLHDADSSLEDAEAWEPTDSEDGDEDSDEVA